MLGAGTLGPEEYAQGGDSIKIRSEAPFNILTPASAGAARTTVGVAWACFLLKT